MRWIRWLGVSLAIAAGAIAVTASAQVPVITSVSTPRQVVAMGQNLTLSVTAASGATPTYQWKRNGRPITGATATSYTITGATVYRDTGWYQAVVSNGSGAATSAVVFVNVAVLSPQILGFGNNDLGQLSIPSGLGAVTAVTGGAGHGLALRMDGTVVGWGYNSFGQATVPPGLNGVVAITAAVYYSVALKSDGTVVAWGNDDFGRIKIPAGLSGVVALAKSVQGHYLALKVDGTVVGWGANDYGQITIPSGLNGVVGVAAGNGHSLALKADGTVVGWGSNSSGEATIPAGLNGVEAVAAGSSFSLALKSNGTVVAWGFNYYGQTAVPADLRDAVGVAAGLSYALAVKADGTVVGWGTSDEGALTFPANLRPVVTVASGYFSLMVRDAAGDLAPTITNQPASRTANRGEPFTLAVGVSAGTSPTTYQWRKGGVAIPGATDASYKVDEVLLSPTVGFDVVVTNHLGTATSAVATITVNASPVVGATSCGVYGVRPGQALTLALDPAISAGATVQWRRNSAPIAGATARTLTLPNATLATAGCYHAVYNEGAGAVTSAPIFVRLQPAATQLVGWGTNNNSALNFPAASPPFVQVVANRGADDMGLRIDGSVALWGYLADVAPAGLSNVVAISGGYTYLALKTDGTVVEWTESQFGGTAANPLPGISDVIAISAAETHSLALRANGTVVAWGSSDFGETDVPAGLKDVTAISAGYYVSLALKQDGTVVAWGANDGGQTAVPAGLSDVIAISAGGAFELALRANGTVVAWGESGTGAAVVPDGLAGVVAISAGPLHALALRADGSLRSWGTDYSGEAVVPAGLGSVIGFGGGLAHSLALRDASGDTPPSFTSAGSAVFAMGLAGTFKVTATGEGPPLTYRVASGTFPLWATLNAQTGVISGIAPYLHGSPFTFTIEAGNGVRLPGTQAFTLNVLPRHSADVSPADGAINLTELTRVIALYNTRFGSERTGRYRVASPFPPTEDGFEPDTTTPGAATVTLASYHSADSNHDGRISLTEVTRVIELYATRSGTTRTGAYHLQAGTEDGFAPGP